MYCANVLCRRESTVQALYPLFSVYGRPACRQISPFFRWGEIDFIFYLGFIGICARFAQISGEGVI